VMMRKLLTFVSGTNILSIDTWRAAAGMRRAAHGI
jgi:hypothetical protein